MGCCGPFERLRPTPAVGTHHTLGSAAARHQQSGGVTMLTGEAVIAFISGYFSTCKRSAKTQAAYRIDLEQLTMFVGPTVSLAEILPSRLEAWAAKLQADEYAPVSIRRKFATARVFFAYTSHDSPHRCNPSTSIRCRYTHRARGARACVHSDNTTIYTCF